MLTFFYLIEQPRTIVVESHMTTVVTARRKVIRLLIMVVVAFVICHLPVHVRKLAQDWWPKYNGGTNSAILFTIFTNLLMYANSAANPILYALMSKKFRNSMRDIVVCRRLGCCQGQRPTPLLPVEANRNHQNQLQIARNPQLLQTPSVKASHEILARHSCWFCSISKIPKTYCHIHKSDCCICDWL